MGFDASVSEVFVTLISGATLCLATAELSRPCPDLVHLLQQQAITVVTLPPSVWYSLKPEDFPALQTAGLGG